MPRFTRAELESFRDAEVPDLLPRQRALKLLFVGINPGLWTAATQTHFAHPVNRFYPALLEAGIIERPIDPAAGMTDADREHLTSRGIGITNVVRRATARADELTDDELRAGGEQLVALVERVRPAGRRARRDHGLPHGVRPAEGRARPPGGDARRRRAVGGAQPERPQRARDGRLARDGVRRGRAGRRRDPRSRPGTAGPCPAR